MTEQNIQLWHSKKQESYLAGLASVWRSVAVDLTTGDTLVYTRAGANPAKDTVRDFSGNVRFRDDFGDAQKIYDGPRSNVAVLVVGSTIVRGALNMVGQMVTPAQGKMLDKARRELYLHGLTKVAVQVGAYSKEEMAILIGQDVDVRANAEKLARRSSSGRSSQEVMIL